MDQRTTKQLLLNELYKPYQKCMECPLALLGRTKVVFGQGNPDARLMIIGEAPGAEEDHRGLPFVGRSGRLLNKTLEVAGIARDDIFITNIVKCRPPSNRAPTQSESAICKSILLYKQIQIIQPTIICTLGATALCQLINKPMQITKVRGTIIEHEGLQIFPTFHPAYVMRNRKQESTFLNDILALKLVINKQKLK